MSILPRPGPVRQDGRRRRDRTRVIEPATRFHVETMAVIHAAAFPDGERWGRDVIDLQLAAPGAFGFIAPAGGFILARVAADESEILTLAVAPEARRGGLGRDLVRAVLAEASIRHARATFLEVSEANAPARALYAGCGFVEVGRRARYYGGVVDALVLRAAIPSVATAG